MKTSQERLNLNNLEENHDECAILWCISNEQWFPLIPEVARKLLSVPAT